VVNRRADFFAHLIAVGHLRGGRCRSRGEGAARRMGRGWGLCCARPMCNRRGLDLRRAFQWRFGRCWFSWLFLSVGCSICNALGKERGDFGFGEGEAGADGDGTPSLPVFATAPQLRSRRGGCSGKCCQSQCCQFSIGHGGTRRLEGGFPS